LGSPQTALDDDEVVDFTQNGGWQKINNLLVLLYRYSRWFRDQPFGSWISCLQGISDRLKVSHFPCVEAASDISFVVFSGPKA
jgi:hypothetical protein